MFVTTEQPRSFESVISLIQDAKSKGLSQITVDLGSNFDLTKFKEYADKVNANLVYKIIPSFSDENPGEIFYLYQTEEAYLDSLIRTLSNLYTSSCTNVYMPAIPEYLKCDISKWYKYITDRINIIKDMYIDRTGSLIIKTVDSPDQIEGKARDAEREAIYNSLNEAFTRKVKRMIEDAIKAGKTMIEFTNITDYDYSPALYVPSSEVMKLINRQSIAYLNFTDVYTFAMELCNNDIDNVFDRISDDDLQIIAEKCVGKTDDTSTMCIYRAEVITDPRRKTKDNRPLKFVRALAYVLRSDMDKEVYKRLNNGVRNGVSLSIEFNKRTCSICGDRFCQKHIPGEVYDGAICYYQIHDVSDVYEFNIVDPKNSTSCKIIPDDSDNTILVKDGDLNRIMNIIYSDFMDDIEGFSYITETKSLVINLKDKQEDDDDVNTVFNV